MTANHSYESLAEEEGPDGVDEGVGEGGGGDALVAATFPAPCATVEEPCDGGEQDVAPVEVGGTLVEVGEAEEDRGEREGCAGSEAALQQILHPAAEEELLRNSDEEKREHERAGGEQRFGQRSVEMQEPERKPESDGDRCVEEEVYPASAEILPAKA